MAIPLNTFKTSTAELQDVSGGFLGDSDVVYTCPNGITAIVLMAQVANISETDINKVTLQHHDTTSDVKTELVKNFEVQPNDAAGLITGKLIVQRVIRSVVSITVLRVEIQSSRSLIWSP